MLELLVDDVIRVNAMSGSFFDDFSVGGQVFYGRVPGARTARSVQA
ncbi:hypothetical protein [Microbacterium sp. NIBRBAC000506063]|nr:hypothetical protein [Microbacterium sp. NIBRBAC000506063]QTV81020.1 hypothetical protein KAE78_14500 [Microbacterium sp. NIBRBAC000506063]